jgi:hypothetical protein
VIFKDFIISDVGHAKFDTPRSSVFCLDLKPSTTNQEYNGAKELTLHTLREADGRAKESSNGKEIQVEILRQIQAQKNKIVENIIE